MRTTTEPSAKEANLPVSIVISRPSGKLNDLEIGVFKPAFG